MNFIEKNGVKIMTIYLQQSINPGQTIYIVDDQNNYLTTDKWNLAFTDDNHKDVRLCILQQSYWVLENYSTQEQIVKLEASKPIFIQSVDESLPKFKMTVSCNVYGNGGVTNVSDNNGGYLTTDWNIKFKNSLQKDMYIFVLPGTPYWVVKSFLPDNIHVDIVASRQKKINNNNFKPFTAIIPFSINPGATKNVNYNNVYLTNDVDVKFKYPQDDTLSLILVNDILWTVSNTGDHVKEILLDITLKQ
jgi:hypothetical protein